MYVAMSSRSGPYRSSKGSSSATGGKMQNPARTASSPKEWSSRPLVTLHTARYELWSISRRGRRAPAWACIWPRSTNAAVNAAPLPPVYARSRRAAYVGPLMAWSRGRTGNTTSDVGCGRSVDNSTKMNIGVPCDVSAVVWERQRRRAYDVNLTIRIPLL